jgi:hypothetical protein
VVTVPGVSSEVKAALCIAGGLVVAVLVFVSLFGEESTDPRPAAECRDETNPAARFRHLPSGFAAETLDAQTQARLDTAAGPVEAKTGSEWHGRQITQGGEPVGAAYVVALGDDADTRAGFVDGFTSGIGRQGGGTPAEVSLAGVEQGKEVKVDTPDGPAVTVTGFAGCHALVASAFDRAIARRIITALAAAPER